MLEFLSAWLLLSLPVFLLLFVNLKGKQRLVYTHTLLSDFQDRTLGDFLFRTFHLYYDIILDLILALLTALFLSGLLGSAPAGTAVCIDGSYSMLLGPPGQTPLDEALRRCGDPELRKADLYLLAFDPRRGRPGLASLQRERRRGELADLRENLSDLPRFFNQDYAPCGALLRRGYSRVMVLSDHEAAPGGSLEFEAAGRFRPQSFFYPRGIDYDFAAGAFRLVFQLWNLKEEVRVGVYREDEHTYAAVPEAEMSIGPDTLLCRLPEAGLYRFAAGDLDFVFNLAEPAAPARVEGEFSRVILEVLPQLEEGDGDLLLADMFYREDSPPSPRDVRREIRRHGAGSLRRAIITFLPASDTAADSYVYPLPASLSLPVAADSPPALIGLDLPAVTLFYQNPAETADPQTPVVYLDALERGRPPPFETLPAGKLSLEQSHRSSYVYRRDGEFVAVNLAAEELYGPGREPPLRFPPPGPRRELILLLLLCCYLAKSVLLLLLERPAAGKSE